MAMKGTLTYTAPQYRTVNMKMCV